MNVERSVHSSNVIQARDMFHTRVQDHNHQFASQCLVTFVHTKYRYDLILADFNYCGSWLVNSLNRQI